MGVWGLLGVSFISFYITVTDSFLLRNERNPRNPRNPQAWPQWARWLLDDRARTVLKKKFAPHQKGKEARKLFPGLPGVYEVL